MFLKRLEVYGFKSFAEKTVLDFTGGVTALVGPNGCGKSNVVDAIRWALGEQSAKSLRGSEMTDLIFNGTSTRRPLGFAQVSLIFDNTRRHLPVETEEVSVTRRLYRTGECEYMINGQPSRLRDIREMFMDTGVGVGAYSIIEQGKIDALLQASAKQRRGIFEEAAGISKYHSRKAAALRKLERVDQNLLRTDDVIGEVERQLRSVVRAAGKARRYRQLYEEMARIRVTVLAADYRALSAELDSLRAGLAEGQSRASRLTARSGQLEAEIATAQTRADELEVSSREAERRKSEGDARLARLEAEIDSARNLSRQCRAEAERARREAGELAERAAEHAAEEAAQRQEQQGLQEERDRLGERVAAAGQAVAAVEQRTAELSAAIELRRSDVVELQRRKSGIGNHVTGLLYEQSRVDNELDRLQVRDRLLGEKLGTARTELGHGERQVRELSARREAVATELERARAEERAAEAELAEVTGTSAQRSAELSAMRAWLQSLEEQEARQDGLSRGVKGVLAAISEGSAPAGMHGIVADLIKVPDKLGLAIDTALGNKVQNVVTADTQAARGAIELLKQERLGRATFLPLDRVRDGRYRPGAETLAEPGVIGRAADLVEFSAGLRPVFEYLLGSTLVVRDLDSAMRLANNGARDGLVVTLEGEIFYPSGAITGGAYRKRIPGIISRRNEIARLEEDINDAQADLADGSLRASSLVARRASARDRAAKLLAEHGSLQSGEARLRQGQEMLGREESRLEEERGLVAREIADLRRKRVEVENQLGTARRQSATVSSEEQELLRDVAGLDEQRRRAESERGELQQRLADLKVEDAKVQVRLSGLTAGTEATGRLVVERRRESEARTAAAGSAERAAEEAAGRCTELIAQRNEAVAAAEQAEQAGRALVGQRTELRRVIDAARDAERQCRRELEAATGRANELRIAERTASMKLEGLIESARREEEGDLARRAEELDPEQINLVALRRQLQEGDEKLRRMGEVNLSAIGEEDALRARREELKTQHSDLEEARKLLRDAISRINRISRERFSQTFELVREHFVETYRKLFGGGKADISLTEGEDVLEAGIEIVARPPGKELRKLSLLSGGERTLTTIALLFAIFKAKPSPFCVLDEVDAPLDESNIDRFMLVLREFLEQSQFLIITHNRRTMADADVIYGVTMQESGVSKRIAVRFEDVGEDLAVA
jgi:chromosome segregation protein